MSEQPPGALYVSRRSVLRAAALTAGAVAVSGAVTTAAQAGDTSGLRSLSLQNLQQADLSDASQTLQAYGWLHAAATLQGLANRSGPRLFVDFLAGDEKGELRIDNYWLQTAQSAGWAAVAAPSPLADIPSAVAAFRSAVHGAVVWDPAVAATSNVASTVAGADSLIAVPYDPSLGSAYSTLVDPAGTDTSKLAVKVWLVNPDGSSLFTGSGRIAGTGRASSGSAKADAYLWALDRYLAAGKCDPTQLAYYLDAYWLTDLQPRNSWPHPLQNTLLANHDYLVAKRGFIFDLSPWDDEAPEDDPNQPVGTDSKVLEMILATAGSLAGKRICAIRGFVPWAYKYSSTAGTTTWQSSTNAEWESVRRFTSHGFFIDADAEGLDPMPNASLFQYYPAKRSYPPATIPSDADLEAAGFLAADGTVVTNRYVMIYTGDYDSASWLYHMMPRVWDDTARGEVTLNWAFDAHLGQRLPLALAHAHDTASSSDFFVAHHGVGYVAPGALTAPEADRAGLLSGWTERCLAAYKQWGLEVTGFIVDGLAQPLTDKEATASFGRFSPAGTVTSRSYPYGMQGATPFVRMGSPDVSDLNDFVALLNTEDHEAAATQAPLRPHFQVARTVLQTPTWTKALMAPFGTDAPPAGTSVSIQLGDPNVDNGLSQTDAQDGVTQVVTVDGITGRSTAPGVSTNRYIYFDIDNSIIDGGPVAATIQITYLDNGTDPFNMQYDGPEVFTSGPNTTRTGTGDWMTTSIPLPDANFASREQGQYDFRFGILPGADDLVLSEVTVTFATPPPPPFRNSQVVFLDAPTFFALLSRHLQNDLVAECSAGILVAGQATSAVFRVQNFSAQAVTQTVALTGPAGTTVTGPTTITVPPGAAKRLAYTVTADASVSGGELTLTVGGRAWQFVSTMQAASYLGASEVSAALGATDTPAGLNRLELGFDGTTVSGSTGGRTWRASDGKNNGFTQEGYVYFDVDDTFLADVDGGAAHVEVDYFDDPGIHFRLDYDRQDHQRMLDGIQTPTRTVATQGTGAWLTAVFDLGDIRFADRIPGQPDTRLSGVADFRIASDTPLKVAAVRLTAG